MADLDETIERIRYRTCDDGDISDVKRLIELVTQAKRIIEQVPVPAWATGHQEWLAEATALLDPAEDDEEDS